MISQENLQPTAHSPTLVMHDLASIREQNGQDIIKFGFGQSPFPPPNCVVEALKKNANKYHYSPVMGLPELCEAVAKHHQKHNNIDCTADNIIVTAGSKALLYAIMAAFKKASIILPAPSWVSYEPQADLLGHEKVALVRESQNNWKINSEALQTAADKCSAGNQKILILNYPGNPDGITYTEDELKALANTARKNNILVISDEIYGLIDFTDTHISMATLYPENTIVTSGLSKWCGAGGWRLGTAIIPDALATVRKTMIGILSEIVSCAPTPVQFAAIEAYTDSPEIINTIEKRRKILKTLAYFGHDTLTNAGIDCTKAEGGIYCFVDFMPMQEKFKQHGITDSNKLCEKLLEETGVALLSGSAFGMDSGYLSARLAFIHFDGKATLEAAENEEINQAFIEKNCNKTCDGFRRIAKWLEQLH